jgi:hypothetical protein
MPTSFFMWIDGAMNLTSFRRIPRKGWANSGMFLCFRPEGTALSAQPEGLGTPKPKTFGPVGAVQGQASIMNGPFRAKNHGIFRFPALRAGLTESALQAENTKTHFPVADQAILGIRLRDASLEAFAAPWWYGNASNEASLTGMPGEETTP